ncbi:MAG: hypothetical protein ACOCXX_02145, partial [Planctomycetota bacterium]
HPASCMKRLKTAGLFNGLLGLATAAPVLVFAVMIAGAGLLLSRAFKVVTTLEWWARRVTGGVFIVVAVTRVAVTSTTWTCCGG